MFRIYVKLKKKKKGYLYAVFKFPRLQRVCGELRSMPITIEIYSSICD